MVAAKTAQVGQTKFEWPNLVRNVIALASLILVVNVTAQVINANEELSRNEYPFTDEIVKESERTAQLDCLTKNIYYEAGHEPVEGKIAVAQITLNRVTAGNFGNGVCGVVNKKRTVEDRIVCQFSWACSDDAKHKAIHRGEWAESADVARRVLLEQVRLAVLDNALYYHATYIENPEWTRKMKPVAKIGQHVFYRE